jgi:hypothetical protein
MNTKTPSTKKKTPAAKVNPNTVQITQDTAKTKDRQIAEIGLSAVTLNSVTARNFTKYQMGETDLTETISVMREKVSKVNTGDLSELEATLTAQSVALDAIFNELARRAALNMGEYINAAERYMRLALKAQAQTVRTIEVLAAMKNPPVVFAKQANISHGNQQVNNGSNQTSTHAPAHTGEIVNQPNELLSENHNATMDTSGTATASGTDKAVAAVETLDRR